MQLSGHQTIHPNVNNLAVTIPENVRKYSVKVEGLLDRHL